MFGYAITDFPVGLAAWMLGHPGFSHHHAVLADELRDLGSTNLLGGPRTQSCFFGPGENRRDITPGGHHGLPQGELSRPPETWARRAYRNLVYFNEVDRGGHFAAWEQPEVFSTELRAALRPLRS